jgi:late competence protein required for DNA uptake (superfamily II DNA/RNA helicase)
MLLRPRQKELVSRAVEALHQHDNTLAVAPTGSGKTIMLSATIGEPLELKCEVFVEFAVFHAVSVLLPKLPDNASR